MLDLLPNPFDFAPQPPGADNSDHARSAFYSDDHRFDALFDPDRFLRDIEGQS
jgi:hypothetical protein